MWRVLLFHALSLSSDYFFLRGVGMGMWFGFTTATLAWSAVMTVSLLYILSSSRISAVDDLDTTKLKIVLHSLIWPFCFGIGISFTNTAVNAYYSASLSELCFYNTCRELWQVYARFALC